MNVPTFLITVAMIFLLGAIGEAIFRRTQIPDVVWLIGAGIVIGPGTGLVTRAQLGGIAPYFAALTLVIVLFEGGSRLRISDLARSAPRSGLLAVLTFALAVGALAVVSMGVAGLGGLPDVWSWKHGLLLGCILGGSSSIIIMPAMAQAAVEPRVANLINLESAFTDALCVVGASVMIDLLAGGGSSAGLALARSLALGILIGGGAGLCWLIVLRLLRDSEHAYPVTLSALLLLYVAIERAGGSAALGILTFAIIVGNAWTIGARLGIRAGELGDDVRGVHAQLAFIIKSFFFTFIGAMMSPPWSLLALGVLFGLLLLAARIPGVTLATIGQGFGVEERRLVTIAMPRGMAAGVLATMPAAAGIPGTELLPTIVFAAVLTTIIIFAIGFPLVRRRTREPGARAHTPGTP